MRFELFGFARLDVLGGDDRHQQIDRIAVAVIAERADNKTFRRRPGDVPRGQTRRQCPVDIGGTGIKLAVLDGVGKMLGEPVRVPTPPPPVAPPMLIAAIDGAAPRLGAFDRVSVGFPGAVRGGRVLTAPHLGTEAWAGFDLQGALAKRWKKPVKVMNDADVQGFGAIRGKGVEMAVTLGTGFGTAIF